MGGFVKLDMGAATETQSSGGTSSPAIYYINSGWERHFYGQEFNTGHNLIGNDISSVTLQMEHNNPNAVYKLVHLDSSDVKTDLEDVDMAWVASNGGLAEYVFDDFTAFTLNAGDKIGIYADGVTGSNSGNWIKVERHTSDVDSNANTYQLSDSGNGDVTGGDGVDLKYSIGYEATPANTKLLGLNDAVISVGTTTASVNTILASTSTYTVHQFTSPSNFVISSGSGNVEYLIVAGGGGGGWTEGSNQGAGGGGGGGVLTGLSSMSSGSYPITIGSAGVGGSFAGYWSGSGVIASTNGGDSTFNGLTASGGGYGGGNNGAPGNGGSGGGGSSSYSVGSGTAGQGYDGGASGGTGNTLVVVVVVLE